MTDTPKTPDDKYQELQQIYLKWHNGHRPLSGFIDELKARETRIETAARIDGMETAKSRVLRRTEIPADAREPTRDIIVLTGEECARIIDLDIAQLKNNPMPDETKGGGDE